MPRETFTYAAGIDSRWKRFFVRGMETVTGGPRLWKLYEEFKKETEPNVWTRCLQMLQVDLVVHGDPLASFPKAGPVVVVANHPFGVVDGMAICQLVSRVRGDYRILINDVLANIEDIRPYLLPIDFRETKQAVATNLRSRANAKKYLQEGGVVIVFPSGGVSTARRAFGMAEDAEWKPFTAKLIQQTRADVVPIFFHGQNSRIFQWASRVSLTLRLSLLVHEIRNKIRRQIEVTIGERIPAADLEAIPDREDLMRHLRETTYRLAPHSPRPRLRRAPKPRRNSSRAGSL
jgi:putative hemolysin